MRQTIPAGTSRRFSNTDIEREADGSFWANAERGLRGGVRCTKTSYRAEKLEPLHKSALTDGPRGQIISIIVLLIHSYAYLFKYISLHVNVVKSLMGCFNSRRSIECFCAAFDEIPFDRALSCRSTPSQTALAITQPMQRVCQHKAPSCQSKTGQQPHLRTGNGLDP